MGYKVCESCGSPDLVELKKLRAEVDRLKRSRAGYIGQFNKAQVQRGELREQLEAMAKPIGYLAAVGQVNPGSVEIIVDVDGWLDVPKTSKVKVVLVAVPNPGKDGG